MRNFILLLSILLSTVCLSSCSVSSYAYSTDDYYVEDRGISYNIIVTYGTPFYFNNVLSYYLYNGIYYYPYRYNSVEYLKPFRTVRPRGFVFVPGRYHVPDYRFRHHSYRKLHFHNPDRMPNHHRISRPKPHNVNRMKINGNSYRPSTRTINRNKIHKSQPRQRNVSNRGSGRR